MDTEDLFTIKVAPKCRKDLQVHSQKLKEISSWLNCAFRDSEGYCRVLYLSGPTGSGKSTSVEVLCQEEGIEVIDYTPELLHNDDLEHEKSNSSQLINFLIRRHSSLSGGKKKRLLLITELPDQYYKDPVQLREELSNVLQCIRHPVIFCLTNSIACWDVNPDRLFTQEFLKANYIDTISLNPVAITFIKKALSRASTILNRWTSEAKLKIFSEEAHGDMRFAMNLLQINTIGVDTERLSGRKMICAAQADKEDTFHMLGRILYAKRINPNVPKNNPKRRRMSVPEPEERTDLEYDPTEILSSLSMSSDTLVDFLFENERAFCSDISKYRQVIDTLSHCDSLVGDWESARTFPDDYVSQIATRTVMWHNFKQSRPGGMYAIAKPVQNILKRENIITKNALKKLPMIGDKSFTSLTAPYKSIIENIIDPNSIELFISRPMEMSWKKGKDVIENEMINMVNVCYKGRKNPKKTKSGQTQSRLVQRIEKQKNEDEEEKFTIEDDSDDSFDEM